MSNQATVPLSPTDAMQLAGAQAISLETTAINKLWMANKVWKAMCAAAPSQTPCNEPFYSEGNICMRCGLDKSDHDEACRQPQAQRRET